jgi:hypothetical protein
VAPLENEPTAIADIEIGPLTIEPLTVSND